mgnify:CR=1 FL=1
MPSGPKRTSHNSVTRFMSTELVYGQKPIMPIEETIMSWMVMWENEMNREDFLEIKIRRSRHRKNLVLAMEKLKVGW